MTAAHDETHMRRAIALARTHVGRTGANPSVGCVIAQGVQVVGEGVTGEGGRPHAEEVALAQAGERARGAVAYVTLEPCAERSAGGTSCSERLVQAGVARVVVASPDSSVFADGRGTLRLQAAGIAVDHGLLNAEAEPLYAAYAPVKSAESPR
jgi:diaminohydroxyphosphoribosylaminopyrimidine deaminase/5-amino-6-(5-phosphoribosylamino)uracil reductase